VNGPLAGYEAEFRARFCLSWATRSNRLHGRWDCSAISARGWNERARGSAPWRDIEVLAAFSVYLRQRGRQLTSAQALRPVTAYLDEMGVLPPLPSASGPVEVVLAEYGSYLLRCAAWPPRPCRANQDRATLRNGLPSPAQGVDGQWAPSSAGDVVRFVTRAGAGYKAKTVNEIVVGLRSFLRFCHAAGLIDRPRGKRR
jgi:hypothetical protein